MSTVKVSRDVLDQLAVDMGLPPGSSVEVMLARGAEIRGDAEAQKAAEKAAVSQRHLVDEDKRLVNAAINDGRLTLSTKQFWVDALGRDRAANRQILASLAPGLRPAQRVVEDESLEATHSAVLGRLGLGPRQVAAASAPTPARAPAQRQVAAAAPAAPPQPSRYAGHKTEYDVWGFPIRQIPDPVLVQKGKPVSEYTHDDHYAVFAQALGSAFRKGAPPVPKRDSYYQGGLNDPSRPVIGADGVVTHFEGNPDYRPGANS